MDNSSRNMNAGHLPIGSVQNENPRRYAPTGVLKIGGLSCFLFPAYLSLTLDGARGTTTTATTTRRDTNRASAAIAMTAKQGAMKVRSNNDMGRASCEQKKYGFVD
jgi:hypothetical protein